MSAPGTGLVWFRRDLRLENNPAWAAATARHRSVVAMFVIEPPLIASAGDARRNLLIAHLRALDDELTQLGGRLVVRNGPASKAVPMAAAECEATGVYLNHDVSSYSARRDSAVARAGVSPIHGFYGLTVHEPGKVLTAKGLLSQVFTPFYRAWLTTPLTPWPEPGPGRATTMASDPLPQLDGPVLHTPGAVGAWQRLTAWLERVDDYPALRDLPAAPGTSELSSDLKFGTIAARTLLEVVGTATPGRSAFARQIAWRDWWAHTLAMHPHLGHRALKPSYDKIEWRNDAEGFDRWCRGLTGYPIVDAGMRQLAATGWMHNRVRMITASFLVKDLLVDWRLGERFFRRQLIDGDLAQNAGNWQWIAGTGPDAAPYFRIFNPVSQGIRFDPTGEYIRRWVHELAEVPADMIHQPHKADAHRREAAGIVIGTTYPAPIVDHAYARTRALDAYRRART